MLVKKLKTEDFNSDSTEELDLYTEMIWWGFRNLGKKLQPNELFLTILKASISGTVRTFTRTRGTCIGGNNGQLTEDNHKVSDKDNNP